MSHAKDIGRRVKALRKQRDLTQAQLAAAFTLTVNMLVGMVKVGVLTKTQAKSMVDMAGLDLATHVGGNSPEMTGATNLIETVYLAVENIR